jgi:hypothetical protein
MNDWLEEIIGEYIGHYSCEDNWYSCPLAEDGCIDDSKKGKGCQCGRDDTIKKLASAIREDMKKRMPVDNQFNYNDEIEQSYNTAINEANVRWRKAIGLEGEVQK